MGKVTGDIYADAWNATKDVNDPDWANIPNLEFKEKLRFEGDRVKATCTTQTNFEKEVLRLHGASLKDAKDEGATAIVDPNDGVNAAGGAAGASDKAKEAAADKGAKKEAEKA